MRLNTDLLAFESCAAVFHRSHYRELIEFLLVAFAGIFSQFVLVMVTLSFNYCIVSSNAFMTCHLVVGIVVS